jgi:hypothetical protein
MRFGSLGIPELLAILAILLASAVPIGLVLAGTWYFHRRSLAPLRENQDDLRRRVEALERGRK